ncbi:MAG: hypothetical protein ACOC5T_08130 [Elusimicrobiota bacterium]
MIDYTAEKIRRLEAELRRLEGLIEKDTIPLEEKQWILLARDQVEKEIRQAREEGKYF